MMGKYIGTYTVHIYYMYIPGRLSRTVRLHSYHFGAFLRSRCRAEHIAKTKDKVVVHGCTPRASGETKRRQRQRSEEEQEVEE